jgi:hypothetical protein
MAQLSLEFTAEFAGKVLGPVPVDEAVTRVVAFCRSPRSGFVGYDGVGHLARQSGRLAEVGPWSILLADALAGRVSVGNVHSFAEHIEAFAARLRAVPDQDLATLNEEQLASVAAFCAFGFAGAWAPKITKVGAIFRPKSIPVLDGYVALAFGYARESFSVGQVSRREAIRKVIAALAAGIRSQATVLEEVRARAEQQVTAVELLSDLRLADIVIWTSQDDRMERTGKPRNAWLHQSESAEPTLDHLKWLPSSATVGKDQPYSNAE